MSITYKIYDKKPRMEGISGNNVLSLRKHFSDIEVASNDFACTEKRLLPPKTIN